MLRSVISRRHLIHAVPSVVGLSAFAVATGAFAANDPPPTPDKDAIARNSERSACLIFEMGISQETMSALQNAFIELHKQGFQNITLMINSFGGQISPVIATYHFLNSLSINLTTYNMADVGSAAIVLYLAGKRRVANDQSRFIFHGAKNEVHGTFGSEDFNTLLTDVDEMNSRIKEIYRSKMNLSDEDYVKFLSPNLRSVRAPEALQIGLVTKIDELSVAASAVFNVAVPTAKNTF